MLSIDRINRTIIKKVFCDWFDECSFDCFLIAFDYYLIAFDLWKSCNHLFSFFLFFCCCYFLAWIKKNNLTLKITNLIGCFKSFILGVLKGGKWGENCKQSKKTKVKKLFFNVIHPMDDEYLNHSTLDS